MPKKRATKAQTKRAKPKLKDEIGDDGLSAAQRELKLAGYLADCDVQIENLRAKYESQLTINECLIDKHFAHLQLQFSQEQRSMTLEEYIILSQEQTDGFDTERKTVLSAKQETVKPSKSALSDTLSKYRSRRHIEPIIEEEGSATSTVKRSKRAAKKTTRGVTFNAEKATESQSSYITPAMNRNASALGWNTPLVTPKFDPRLPITPAQRRNARPNEIAISMAGSPLNVDSKQSLSVNRKGRTLQIQMPDEYEDMLDTFDIPDSLDLENNSDSNIKKMMDVFALIMKKNKEDH